MMTGDDDVSSDDVQYHVELAKGDVEGPVLLPGDPDRVEVIADCWDEYDEKASHREYRTLAGTHDGEPVTATSTGIGSPSAAIAVEELARVGAETVIRVGSCGAIQAEAAAVVMTRSPTAAASWMAPQEPTRTNVSAPTRASSSTAMAVDGDPIPVEVTETGSPS